MSKYAFVFVTVLEVILAEEFIDKPTTNILEGVPGSLHELRRDGVENTDQSRIKLLPENDRIPEEQYNAWNPEFVSRNFIPYPYAKPVAPKLWPANGLQRTSRSEDDLWDEVEQDAVMHNVLPIMPAPYFRSSQSVPPPVFASFPTAMGDCAVPILVSCTPQIMRGTIGKRQAVLVPVSFMVKKNE